MNRRELLKTSLLSGDALLLSAKRIYAQAVSHPTGGVFDPPSPEVKNPFTVELPRMPIKHPLANEAALSLPENGGVVPNGTVYPQVTGNDALTTYMNSLERIVAAQTAEFCQQYSVLSAKVLRSECGSSHARISFGSTLQQGKHRMGIRWNFSGTNFREPVWSAYPRSNLQSTVR